MNQTISVHLWYDTQALEAAELYAKVFPSSAIQSRTQLHDTPSGTVDMVTMQIWDSQFTLLSAGPYFHLTPAISFLISCDSPAQVEQLWNALAEGGTPLMELGSYPFSPKYGWIQDRFGVTWQLMYREGEQNKQRVIPTLMFVGEQCGKAEEAITHYTSIFDNARMEGAMRYEKGEAPDKAGTLKHAQFTLAGQWFAAMDSAHEHKFNFTEAISLVVTCQNQKEIDYYWQKLSAVPESEQCGWLKDRYGVSWQIVPRQLAELLNSPDTDQVERVTQAFLKMKKFEIAELEKAARGA